MAALEDEENQDKLLVDVRFWAVLFYMSDIEVGEGSVRNLSAELESPLPIPVFLANVWNVGAVNYCYSLGRSLALEFPKGEAPDSAIIDWLNRYPVDVYGTAFSWEVRCRAYAENGGRLTGVRGALLLAHAAFATLMTGLELDGPVWLELLGGRDRGDALVEGSYLLFEICSFRDGEESFRRLRELAASAPAEKRPVFEAAGLLG